MKVVRQRRGWALLLLLLLPGVALAVQAAAPVASFSVSPAQPSTNDVVVLDASSSFGQGAALTRYDWDFDGDGQVDQSGDQSQLRHFFDAGGTYPVTLWVHDGAGGQATFTRNVEVSQAPVTARRTFEGALEDNRVLAGGTLTVTVTLRVNEPLSGLGLVESPPAGWRDRPVDDGGAVFKREGDALQWLWAESLEPGRTLSVRYAVTVSETAPRGTYAIEGEISSFGLHKFQLPVFSLFDIEVL